MRLVCVAICFVIYMLFAAVWDALADDKSFGHGLVSNAVPGLIVGVFTFLVMPEVAMRWQRSREQHKSPT